MNKEETIKYIKDLNIWYEIDEHEKAYTMEDLKEIKLSYPEYDAKNIFLRDDKNENFYLITIIGFKKLDVKSFQKEHNTRHLSFANEEQLYNYLKLTPGSVTPLGLLNNESTNVKFYLDSDFLNGKKIIGVHPNDNSATMWLKTEDLISIIKNHGNEVNIINIK